MSRWLNFKNKGFGYRTLKTVIGVSLALLIAQAINLEFYSAAGILTILCIQRTRKKSIITSWNRFVACMIGIAFAGFIFEIVSYHPLSVGLLLLLFIPLMVKLNLQEGIVTSAVIIMHIYTVKEFTGDLVINELALIIIGIGSALIMNLYMPNVEKDLRRMKEEIESNFQHILKEFSTYIRFGDRLWDGYEITEVTDLLSVAKNNAIENIENHIFRYEDPYYQYFKMREKQLDIFEQMMPLLTTLPNGLEQGEMVADFIEDLADGIHYHNTAYIYLEKLEKLEETFRKMDLPSSREEFEGRAALLQLMKELEKYLYIKQQFLSN